MAGAGEVVLGPSPWVVFPLGPVQVFVGYADPPWALRAHLLRGPWFAWLDFPPPRFALGRSPGHALLALVREGPTLNLSWEIMGSPWFSLFGSLGGENTLGLRFRWRGMWWAGLVRRGGLSLWWGVYF